MLNVLEWLEASARKHPDKLAVADPEHSYTYAELRDKAQILGTWIAKHAQPRCAVAFYLEKSCIALASMFGAVYAGDFYSVLDVRQPKTRVLAICESLQPAIVFTDAQNAQAAAGIFAGTPWKPVCIEDALEEASDPNLLEQRRSQTIDADPLYVNFTSGSTGTPKGVVISHRSVIDFIPLFTQSFGIDETDVIGNQAPFDFDVSVKDIYSSMYRGATLRIIPRPYFSQPAQLMDYLADSEVTTLIWAVSALCFVSIMNGLDYRLPEKVDKILFSGEVMPPKQLRVWREHLPEALFVNLYGPTEITCNCTYYRIERDFANDEVIPMGKPFANERVFLLDEDDAEVIEAGVEGEICVSGTALGLGYLGDVERTAAAFTQNPLNDSWLEPIYRTGDLACYNEDGDLVYAGRKDHQIKFMGQRIELGDIEAAAHSIDGVERACCIFNEKRKKLTLFYVGNIERDTLVEQLETLVPQFMVPNTTRQIDEMPLTKNGKIDRQALAIIKGKR